MKRQKRTKVRSTQIQTYSTQIPEEVYTELMDTFKPKCKISLKENIDENYIPLEDNFREYTVHIEIPNILCMSLNFSVDITDSGLFFEYGTDEDDEYSLKYSNAYSSTYLMDILNSDIDNVRFLPPFLVLTDTELQLYKCIDRFHDISIKLESIDSNSLYNLKKQYDDMIRWAINKHNAS